MTKKKLLLGAALCALAPLSVSAQDAVRLPEVLATGEIEYPQTIVVPLSEDTVFPASDGGAYLQSVPGVSGSRMGSHGIDPFIRGQKQTQLNIIDDGVYVHGGCPNRMDPPSSFLSLEGNDELIVEKGYTSVQNGPGGSGGTVKTKRNAPIFAEGETVKATVSGGYDGNGDARDAGAKLAVKFGETGYLRANAEAKKARSYEDGNGQDVRAGFRNTGGRVDVGFSPNDGMDVTMGVQVDHTTNALFAGAGMDAPLSDLVALRGTVEQDVEFGLFDALKGSAFISQVDHVMDNYTLRARTGMGMLTASETQIYGGSFSLDGSGMTLGTDLKISDNDALRYMGAQNANIYAEANQHAFMWPGVETSQIGLFAEKTHDIDEATSIKVGARYDYVRVTASKTNQVSARTNRSADDVYQLYYGRGWENTTEHNLGGLLRLDHRLNDQMAIYGSLSRVVRTADVTERSMAGDHATAANRWVGNPDIDPEQHHQIELGSSYTSTSWGLGGSVYYNKVSNYILRDNAQGQDGVLLSDNADIYRNVDATLMGAELTGSVDLSDHVSFKANVAYTYGDNDEDSRPLAQIAPLEFGGSLEYTTADWMAGLRVRGAAKQNRADVGSVTSGQDIEKTGGYAAFDLYGQIWALEPAEISLGVTNLFDKTYSNHLNRGSSFDNTVAKVNEPGRSFFIRLNAEF